MNKKLPDGVTKEERRGLNRKTVGIIRLYINHYLFHHVVNNINAYEMRQKLESMYKRKKTMNKISMIKMLEKLEYQDRSNAIEHWNVFQFHINQLPSMDINFEHEVQSLLMLNSMSNS
jgi:hypothetical protein